MQFREIEGHTFYGDASTSVTFKCEPPLLFRPADSTIASVPGGRPSFALYAYVTVCAFRKSEEFPYGRTVIHATEQLQGGDGFCYGALAEPLVMDAHDSAWTALNAFGYTAEPQDDEGA